MNESDSHKVTSEKPVTAPIDEKLAVDEAGNSSKSTARARKILIRRAARAQRLSLGAQSEVGLPVIPEAEGEPAAGRHIALERLRQRKLSKRQSTPDEEDEGETADEQEVRPAAWKSKKSNNLFRLAVGFLLFVGIPTGISITYFCGIAADQYVSIAQFAIRSNAISSDGSRIAASPLNPDMFVVKDYVASLQVLDDIKTSTPEIDVRKIFSDPRADDFARLNPDATDVELLKYWRDMVTVNYDLSTGLGALQVRAFNPEESLLIANAVLRLSEKLVNNMTERARADTLALARDEVKAANERVHKAIDAMTEASKKTLVLDANQSGAAMAARLASLEVERIELKNKIDLISRNSPDSPQLRAARQQLLAIEATLAEQQSASTISPDGRSQVDVLNQHDKLAIEKVFAQQAYSLALARLDTAHIEVLRQGEYLEAYVRPQLATSSEYPRRLSFILLTFVCATITWMIGRLLFAAILEHL